MIGLLSYSLKNWPESLLFLTWKKLKAGKSDGFLNLTSDNIKYAPKCLTNGVPSIFFLGHRLSCPGSNAVK